MIIKIDERQAKTILNQLGVIDYDEKDLQQFIKGIAVESEHGTKAGPWNITNNDIYLTAKIALAHLYEKKNYYDLLEKYVENDFIQ